MVEFCSPEYMGELMKRVNSDQEFPNLRKTGRNATYTFHLEAEPENGVDRSLIVGFAVLDGRMSEVWSNIDKTTEFTDLVITGRYGTWVDIIRNRLSLTEALLSRKLSLRGETDQIFGPTVWMSPEPIFAVELTGAADRIIEIARTIPVTFQGKYSSNPTQH